MVCCGQKNNKFLHLLGVPRKRLRIGNGSDTLISPDLDHASVGKRNLAEQAQQKQISIKKTLFFFLDFLMEIATTVFIRKHSLYYFR